MALTEVQIAKLQVDVEAGKLSKNKIAQKHSISRNTLDKYIKDEGWFYAKYKQDLSKIIHEKTTERLINDEVDRASKLTTQFLGDIDTYRKLAMMPANELAIAYNEARKSGKKVKKDEFARIKESSMAIKIAIESLNTGYNGVRKALGMDIEADVIKQRQLKQQDKQKTIDPLEDITEEQLDEEIKKLQS